MNINPRIFGAFVVGAGLVVGSYFLTSAGTPASASDPNIAVVSGPVPDRKYIEVGDSDNDGIPNWKEQFRYTEPVQITQSTEPVETYAPPETLTGKIAIELLSDSVRAKEYGPFGSSPEEILRGASAQIDAASTDVFYTSADISVSPDNSLDALRVYGNKVAEIVIINGLPAETRGELEILQHGVYSKDESVLEELLPIIEAYTNMRDAMLIIPVPAVVAKEHLDLLNVYNALLTDIDTMHQAFTDPLYTMVRSKRYYDDAQGLNNAIVNLYTTLHEKGARWTQGDVVPQFVTITE